MQIMGSLLDFLLALSVQSTKIDLVRYLLVIPQIFQIL